MCGIFGYLGDGKVDLRAVTDLISYRGPDSAGFLRYDICSGKSVFDEEALLPAQCYRVCFGFRRLSIIDLSSLANQPFTIPSEGLSVVYNGEIYNYIELRQELESKGYEFRTKSDTEVLLGAYREWGEACTTHFNGMWAFAILDEKTGRVFCSRDRFGVKPFFYHFDEASHRFIFASEIKQILKCGAPKRLNERVLRDFLESSITDHTTETWFEDIHSLQPGSSITIEFGQTPSDLKYRILPYWKLKCDTVYSGSYRDAAQEFRELFIDAIKLRYRSDVPVGVCLSGGLDSSSIVSASAGVLGGDVRTFSSVFDEKEYDESSYVAALREKYPRVQNAKFSVRPSDCPEHIDKLLFHQDEPFGNLGILAQWSVMRLARNNGVTVLLDGQGADEYLAGYRKFYFFFLKDMLLRGRWGTAASGAYHLVANNYLGQLTVEGVRRYSGRARVCDYLTPRAHSLPATVKIGLAGSNTLAERSRLDLEHYSLPALLRFEDRNSMAFSIESRTPFLDYRLVELGCTLPPQYIIRGGYTKSVLRDGLNGVLPDAVRKRTTKLGFATPLPVWMAKSLKPYFSSQFQKLDNPYIDMAKLGKEFDRYPASSLHAWDFFRVFCFSRWFHLAFVD